MNRLFPSLGGALLGLCLGSFALAETAPPHRLPPLAPEAPQKNDSPPSDKPLGESGDGVSLMEEGAKMLLRGLISEFEPSLNEMGEAFREIEPQLRQFGPQMRELFAMIGDFRNYEAPVKLENGDILIRRRPEAAPEKPLWPKPQGPNGEIEL